MRREGYDGGHGPGENAPGCREPTSTRTSIVISSERPAGWVVLDELDPVVALLAGHYSAAGNARFLEGGHSRGVVVTLADVR